MQGTPENDWTVFSPSSIEGTTLYHEWGVVVGDMDHFHECGFLGRKLHHLSRLNKMECVPYSYSVQVWSSVSSSLVQQIWLASHVLIGVDFSWQPIFLLSGNLPVVRAFFGSFPKNWFFPKYAHLIQAIVARYMAKKGQKRPFWAISGSGGTKWNKARHTWPDALEPLHYRLRPFYGQADHKHLPPRPPPLTVSFSWNFYLRLWLYVFWNRFYTRPKLFSSNF